MFGLHSACTALVRNAGAPHGPRANALHHPVCSGASFWWRTRSAEVANWPHFATGLHCVDQSETRMRHLHCTRGDASAEDEPSSRSMANHIHVGSIRKDNIGRICHGIVDAGEVCGLIFTLVYICMC